MPSLTVRQLAVVRGDRTILRDLSFTLGGGQALHIHGPNGAGKTTLLETLAGLRRAERGEILGAPEPERMHYLGVRNALSPMLSPLQNLEFWCGVHGVSPSGAVDALKVFAVAPLRHRPCRTLSNGQRRRVALSRLLLAPRDWWLLDEPLNALDRAGAELFVHFLSMHLQRGGSAIVASHQELPTVTPAMQRLELR